MKNIKLAKLTKKQIIFIVGISVCIIISIVAVVAGIMIEQSPYEDEPMPEDGEETSEMKEEEKKETAEEAVKEEIAEEEVAEKEEIAVTPAEPEPDPTPVTHDGVCPADFGNLMLINPNFNVTTSWIALRSTQLINITDTYGIEEGNVYNGSPMMEPEAAAHLNDMLTAYTNETGGTMTTRSCFRSRGTSCGRLCYATGTSDHHTGLTCDLIDDQYGNVLDTDYYDSHPEWQWLYANSYKYGFIDRFPYEWAGGPMSQPVNVDENGTTGLYETWHYRYVGVAAATEIATGKYNGGSYDSLEHYLKSIGLISDLLGPADCDY